MDRTATTESTHQDAREYWIRLRSKIHSKHKSSKGQVRKGTAEVTVAELPLLREVSMTLFDKYSMPAWSIDYEGHYLDNLNSAALSMVTQFAETMQTERPPEFTEQERGSLVSKALALSTSSRAYPTIFSTKAANWLLFPTKSDDACCVIVLLR